MLIKEFAELMKYKRPEFREPIIIDIDDVIEKREIITFGLDGKQEYVKEYKEKVEKRIKELAKEHPTIQKILQNEVISEIDIEKLEETLNSPDLVFNEEIIKQFYSGTFVNFIKEIFGLYKEQSPEEKIEDAFNTYLVEHNKEYNADQFNFIRTLKSVFMKNKHIEFGDLFDAPFTNFGNNAPIPMFQEEDLKGWVDMCGDLEHQAFAV